MARDENFDFLKPLVSKILPGPKIRHRAPARSVCGFRLLSSQLDSSKILDSELELLLEDSKDLPKTSTAGDMPIRPSPPEAYLTPQSASRRLQDPSRRLQDGSKMPPEASKTPSDASKTPQDASKRPPRPSKIDFSSQHGFPKPQKTIKIYWKNSDSEPLHEFNMRSLLYQTLMPTWLHFGVKFPSSTS